MITVALADDHTLIRHMLTTLINTFEAHKVICTAANGNELVNFIRKHKVTPDIAILDLKMPGMNGYATAAWLKKNAPGTRILMLTMYDSEVIMVRLMASGVRGFLKKDVSPTELKTALELVMQKGYYYQGNSSERLANLLRNTPGNLFTLESVMLSENEISFIRHACSDDTYKEISEKMNLSQRTIDSLRDHLFDKLQVKSRVTLVLYAVHHGILIEE